MGVFVPSPGVSSPEFRVGAFVPSSAVSSVEHRVVVFVCCFSGCLLSGT